MKPKTCETTPNKKQIIRWIADDHNVILKANDHGSVRELW